MSITVHAASSEEAIPEPAPGNFGKMSISGRSTGQIKSLQGQMQGDAPTRRPPAAAVCPPLPSPPQPAIHHSIDTAPCTATYGTYQNNKVLAVRHMRNPLCCCPQAGWAASQLLTIGCIPPAQGGEAADLEAGDLAAYISPRHE